MKLLNHIGIVEPAFNFGLKYKVPVLTLKNFFMVFPDVIKLYRDEIKSLAFTNFNEVDAVPAAERDRFRTIYEMSHCLYDRLQKYNLFWEKQQKTRKKITNGHA